MHIFHIFTNPCYFNTESSGIDFHGQSAAVIPVRRVIKLRKPSCFYLDTMQEIVVLFGR